MSYSFSVTADSKEDAKLQIAQKFDDVVAAQPSHATDQDAAVAAGEAFVDLLAEPNADQQIEVTIYGSLSWEWNSDPIKYSAGNISVSAGLRLRPNATK
jgi:hypothetical protein